MINNITCRGCNKPSVRLGARCVFCLQCLAALGTVGRRSARIVNDAIRAGQMKPASEFACVDCNGPARMYDHRDYEQPLKVDPVCASCNQKRGHAVWHPQYSVNVSRRTARKTRAAA